MKIEKEISIYPPPLISHPSSSTTLYVSTFNNKWIYKYWRRGINVISISHTPWWWWLWWLCSRELKQCWGLFKHSDLICIRFRLNSHTHTHSLNMEDWEMAPHFSISPRQMVLNLLLKFFMAHCDNKRDDH